MMFNLKNRYPIGIDITDQNIYAAQFQKTRQGISVRELFHRKLNHVQTDGAKPDDTLVPVLKEIAKNKRFRGKSVSIHLPAWQIYRFPITFEIAGDETLEDGMVRECRRHLSFPLEEAVIVKDKEEGDQVIEEAVGALEDLFNELNDTFRRRSDVTQGSGAV